MLLAATALAAALLAPAQAATIVVTTTSMAIDASVGSCTDAANDIEIADLSNLGGDGATSLPEAICSPTPTTDRRKRT